MFPECFAPILHSYYFLQFKSVFKIITYSINNEHFIGSGLDEERSGAFQLVQLFIYLHHPLFLPFVPSFSSWNACPSLPRLNCRGLPRSLLLEKPHLIILQSLSHFKSLFSTCHDLTFSCVCSLIYCLSCLSRS